MRPTPHLLSRIHIILDTAVKDVRAFAGYNARDWKKFKEATRIVAQSIYHDGKPIPMTWNSLDDKEKTVIHRNVNDVLRNEGLRNLPDKQLMLWRMHRVFKTMRQVRKATEARHAYTSENASAGFSTEVKPHISRLRRAAREHMRAYATQHPHLTWTEIPFRVKHEMKDAINDELAVDGIPPAGEDFMFHQLEMALMMWKVKVNRRARAGKEVEGGEG